MSLMQASDRRYLGLANPTALAKSMSDQPHTTDFFRILLYNFGVCHTMAGNRGHCHAFQLVQMFVMGRDFVSGLLCTQG